MCACVVVLGGGDTVVITDVVSCGVCVCGVGLSCGGSVVEDVVPL